MKRTCFDDTWNPKRLSCHSCKRPIAILSGPPEDIALQQVMEISTTKVTRHLWNDRPSLFLKQLESDLVLEGERNRKLESDKRAVDTQLVALESRLATVGDGQAELQANFLAQISDLESKLEQEKDEKNRTEIKRAELDQELQIQKSRNQELACLKS